ncbi:hypothetical protein B0H63DRAFT_519557 [Podospora didyma]|uniref:Uncharacterized protein n=1 Tax=Podospora didyma TaxID=330526 RepID=A0AAE0U4H4_9PEZI|nr:hypothetical protein B0H63DRAFT_519557 [Podospora didyma]
MCTGDTVKLICGHSLVHFRTRCEKKCDTPKGEVSSIHDTCASCHPEMRIAQLNRNHALLMREATEHYSAATKEGRSDDAKQLKKYMQDLRVKREGDVEKWNELGRGGLDNVIWPGKDEREEWNYSHALPWVSNRLTAAGGRGQQHRRG